MEGKSGCWCTHRQGCRAPPPSQGTASVAHTGTPLSSLVSTPELSLVTLGVLWPQSPSPVLLPKQEEGGASGQVYRACQGPSRFRTCHAGLTRSTGVNMCKRTVRACRTSEPEGTPTRPLGSQSLLTQTRGWEPRQRRGPWAGGWRRPVWVRKSQTGTRGRGS